LIALRLESVLDFQIQLIATTYYIIDAGLPFSIAFEWQMAANPELRIMAGEFDVVLPLLPVTAVVQ
jgi:hypothetical protein